MTLTPQDVHLIDLEEELQQWESDLEESEQNVRECLSNISRLKQKISRLIPATNDGNSESELGKLEAALNRINYLFVSLHNDNIDSHIDWEKAQKACEACAEPQRTALLFVLAQIAVVVMVGR
jgi:chromosome segregation ATPase